jgi:uncharacterized protein
LQETIILASMSLSTLALPLSIAFILILVRFKLPVAVGVLGGCLLLMALVIPFDQTPALILKTVEDQQTWELFVVVPCTLAFSSFMDQKGLLTRLTDALAGIGARIAIHLLPAIIGLVPMPAGALVAATAEKKLAENLKIQPQHIAFINYWFRHIWEFSMPFYPTIMVVSTISAIPLATVVKTLFPMTVLAVILGAIVSYWILRNTPPAEKAGQDLHKNIFLSLIKAIWPILLLIILIFIKVEAWIAFPIVLVLVIIQQKIKWKEMKKALKEALNPWILFLLLAVMLYQTVVKNTDSASAMITYIRSSDLPSVVILVGIPLLVGLAVGYGPAVAGISLPLMLPFIVDSSGIHTAALLVVCVSGMVGQLLSPAHLCFGLSVAYFKTSMGKVYRLTVPVALLIVSIAVLDYIFFN